MNPKRNVQRLAALLGVTASLALAKVPEDTVTCRVELDNDVLPAGRTVTAVVKVTLDAAKAPSTQERPPVNLSIVLDRSGSMRGEKIEKAKQAAIEALRRLNGRDVFSLVIYNHTVETVIAAQSAANTDWIEARIRQISAAGNTALFAGVSQGAAEIRKNLTEAFVQRIILLSDGLANTGPSSPDDLGRLGAGLVKEGISVTTVGVGTDYNEDLMAQLSQKSDGNTYFVQTGSDLPRIFGAELGEVLSVVAKKVKLTIECDEGVTPVSVLGREGRINGQKVELYLNQLYGGQEKYALVKVEIPVGQAGQSRNIAVAKVTYDNPFTRTPASSAGELATRFSTNQEEVISAANVGVQKAFEFNRNAMIQNDAIALADQGKLQQAVQVLKQSAVQMRRKGQQFNDKDLLQKARQMDDQAAELDAEGMSRTSRKAIRAEAYQDLNQQIAR